MRQNIHLARGLYFSAIHSFIPFILTSRPTRSPMGVCLGDLAEILLLLPRSKKTTLPDKVGRRYYIFSKLVHTQKKSYYHVTHEQPMKSKLQICKLIITNFIYVVVDCSVFAELKISMKVQQS